MTFAPVPASTIALAESLNTHLPLGPEDERIATDAYVIWLGSERSHPAFTVVQRLRLRADRVEETVAEIRALLEARGRHASTWEIGPSAEPADLRDRLVGLGFTPFEEPCATGMVLRRPLPPNDARGATRIEARRATTPSDYEVAYRILNRVFGERTETEDERRERAERACARDAAGAGAIHVGWLDGAAVAAASSIFVDDAVILAGGATLPEARGRGAYRALVQARYDDACARGTPTLVIQAGTMSKPILERLGFEAVAHVDIFVPPA